MRSRIDYDSGMGVEGDVMKSTSCCLSSRLPYNMKVKNGRILQQGREINYLGSTTETLSKLRLLRCDFFHIVIFVPPSTKTTSVLEL
jgi:hypothetical protein